VFFEDKGDQYENKTLCVKSHQSGKSALRERVNIPLVWFRHFLECIREADSHQPENHKKQWQDSEKQEHFFAQYGFEEVLAKSDRRKESQRAVCGSQEKRPCGDKQAKAHAPKMSRDTRRASNPDIGGLMILDGQAYSTRSHGQQGCHKDFPSECMPT